MNQFGINIDKYKFYIIYKYIFHIILFALGISVCIIGFLANRNQDLMLRIPALPSLFYAIGPLFMGISMSSFFSKVADQDIINEFGLLANPKFTSEQKLINDYRMRKQWHMFYVNKLSGDYKWLHIPCDFSKVSIPGYLNTNEKNELPPDGKEYSFNIEAGIRNEALITIHNIDQKEPLIRVFPNIKFDNRMRKIYCGFVICTTLDHTRLIAPTILTYEPNLFGEVKNGEITDPEKIKEMNNKWCEGIADMDFECLFTPSDLLKINKDYKNWVTKRAFDLSQESPNNTKEENWVLAEKEFEAQYSIKN